MSNTVHSGDTLVTSGTFKNTESGTKTPQGVWIPARNQVTGAKLYNDGFQLTTQQVDRKFPLIIKASKLAKVQQDYTKSGRTLQLADGADYRLVSDSVSTLPENEELELPAIQQARYRPVKANTEVSFG